MLPTKDSMAVNTIHFYFSSGTRKLSCCVGVTGTGSLTANASHASLIEFAKCSAESKSGKAGEKVPRS